jgi:hypothetical protein
MMNRTLGLLTIAILLYSTASNADVTDSWKTECVGRYQFSVPGDVDVAVDKPTYKGSSSIASYADGQETAFAKLDYYGYLTVISPASENDFDKLKQIISKNREKASQTLLNIHSPYSESSKRSGQRYKPLTFDTPTMFGWDTEGSDPGIFYFRDNKIFSYSPSFVSGYDHETSQIQNAENIKHYNSFLNDFRTRAIFEMPKQEGVCIPYGFIPDDGKQPSDIAVNMRLIDHPDVEIIFEDGAASEDPKMAINLFFDGYSNGERKIETDLWGYRSITMGGQKGSAVLVTITHMNNTKDYGYVAYVKGDANNPSQMFYVIRTASLAKGKPVSKDELKDMAEKIIASVKRRPVQ